MISEHCASSLRRSIVEGEGVPEDDNFWRWASQLARGIAYIHAKGIIHLHIKPECVRLNHETGDVRISGFENACTAEAAAAAHAFATRSTDNPEYRAPEESLSVA